MERIAAKAGNRQGLDDEWNRCAQDAAHFIDSYVVIDEPQGADSATVPFRLWPAQREALGRLVDIRLAIVLKARQLGITWLCCAYALWLCIFRPGRVVLLFSKGQLEANELARRIGAMYSRLPDWMRERRRLVRDNTTELEWDNGSRVQSLAATKGAGRSFTASLVLMDEAAHMQYATDLYTALKPTIDGGGQLLMVSTANGRDGLFHRIWTNALAGLNEFAATFLSWRVRPGRDDVWRAKVAAESVSSALDLQEYPDTAEEAFQSTESERFLPSMTWWDSCVESIPPLTKNDPMVVALDAASGRKNQMSDCFGLVGVTRYPSSARNRDVMVRYVRKWQARAGEQIPYGEISDECRRLHREFNVVCFTYDPTQLIDMAQRMREDEISWWREFSQGEERQKADKQLHDLVVTRRVVHDGNPNLREHLDNADIKKPEDREAIRIVKRSEGRKIDLAVCLSMASAVCLELDL